MILESCFHEVNVGYRTQDHRIMLILHAPSLVLASCVATSSSLRKNISASTSTISLLFGGPRDLVGPKSSPPYTGTIVRISGSITYLIGSLSSSGPSSTR